VEIDPSDDPEKAWILILKRPPSGTHILVEVRLVLEAT
jgi:hypothetical protein